MKHLPYPLRVGCLGPSLEPVPVHLPLQVAREAIGVAEERHVELPAEEGLAMLSDGIHFIPMALDLLLDFIPSGTLEAEAKERRTGKAATLAHGEVGLVMKAHRTRTLPEEYAPAERMVAEAALRAPMMHGASALEVELSQVGQPVRCGRNGKNQGCEGQLREDGLECVIAEDAKKEARPFSDHGVGVGTGAGTRRHGRDSADERCRG